MKKTVLSLATKAIIIPSIADNNPALKDVLSLFLRTFEGNAAADIRMFRHNNKPSVIVLSKKGKPKIWLNAHLDVVPGGVALFQPKIKGSKLFGRGVLDMKLAAACFTVITDKLIRQGLNVGLMLVTDEEIGGHNGTKMLLEKGIVSPKFVIAGEPTNLQIGNLSKGFIRIDIQSNGVSAHGSRPWLGQNAIQKLIPALNRLEKAFPIPKKEIWQTTVNVGKISGGKTVNQVPDRCFISLDVRFVPTDDPKNIISQIRQIFQNHEVVAHEPENPTITDRNNPFVVSFSRACNQIGRFDPVFRKGHGSSDARFFTKKGIPAIAFGLRGDGLHADHEWVSLSELDVFCKIVESFIKNHQ